MNKTDKAMKLICVANAKVELLNDQKQSIGKTTKHMLLEYVIPMFDEYLENMKGRADVLELGSIQYAMTELLKKMEVNDVLSYR